MCDMPGRLEVAVVGRPKWTPCQRLQRSSHRRTQVKITTIKGSGLGRRLPLRKPPNLASPPARQSQKFVPAPFSGCCSPCHPCHINMGAGLSFAAVCSPELTCTRRPAMAPFQRAIRSLQNAEKAHDKWVASISSEAPAAIPAVVECATC